MRRERSGLRWRRRRASLPPSSSAWAEAVRVLGCAVVLAVTLGAPVAAGAQTSEIDLGPGSAPSVAIDEIDYAHIVWNGPDGDGTVHYCRLPPTAAACDIDVTIAAPGGPAGRPFVFTGSGLQILTSRSGLPSGGSALLYSATDGGRAFSGPVAVGSIAVADAKYGPGDALSLAGGSSYQRAATDGSTVGAFADFADPAALAVDLIDQGRDPLVVFQNAAGISFRRHYGSSDPNVPTEWSPLTAIAGESFPRLTGRYLLSYDDPVGLRLREHRSGDTIRSPGRFEEVSVLPESQGAGVNSDMAWGTDGILHVVWSRQTPDGPALYRATSDRGTDWTRSEVRPPSSAPIADPRVAAGRRGSSVVAWTALGQDGEVLDDGGSGSVATTHVVVRRTSVRGPAPQVDRPNIRATGLEVTQGIQTRDERFAGGELPSDRDPFGALTGRPSTYEGVALAEGSRTIVRLFGNTDKGSVGGVKAELYGFRDGRALPGSPLRSESGRRTLSRRACACVLEADRVDPNGAFEFTLPSSWASGNITLRGKLTRLAVSQPFQVIKSVPKLFPLSGPKPTILRPAILCLAATCASDDAFQLSDVPFTKTARIFIAPLRMVRPDSKTDPYRQPDPESVFDAALKLHPGGERYVVLPYVADLDVSTEYKLKPTDAKCQDATVTDAKERDKKAQDCRQNAYFNAAFQYAYRHKTEHDLHIGITADERGAADSSLYNLPPGNLDPTIPNEREGTPAGFVNIDRPVTSVAHELGHLIGRGHAGRKCGGGGDEWPPDDRGLIAGVGYDRYGIFTSPALGRPSGPIFGGATKQPAEWFDVMSYCAGTGEGADLKAWMSVRGWDSELGALHRYGKRVGFDRTEPKVVSLPKGRSARAASPGAMLAVTAFSDGAATTIESVIRSEAPSPADPGSETFLVGRASDGAELARVAMSVGTGHIEGGSSFSTLTAAVPAAGITSVEIIRSGAVLASRTASATAPTVKVTAPKRGARVPGRGGVVVRWQASDLDGDALRAAVLYSPDGGRSWRTVTTALSTGRATVPAAYLAGSRRGRVRVVVNDGFHESAATSAPFRAAGHPPTVRILAPGSGTRVRADTTVSLAGEAIADSLKLLTGSRLRWFDGKRRLGSGERVAVSGLRPGVRRIRLVATDAAGRRAEAVTTLRVTAVDPDFTLLRAPVRLAKSARRLSFAVATNLPARLTVAVAGRRTTFRVSSARRQVSVRVPRGRKLQLGLLLRSGARQTTTAIAIPRK